MQGPHMELRARGLMELEEAAARGARSILRRQCDIDDAVQEALLRWMKRMALETVPEEVAAWMFRVGQNETRRWLVRERRSRRSEVPAEDLAEAGALDCEAGPALQWSGPGVLEALGSLLTARQREVVQAAIEPGTSMHEAARRVGMDCSTFRRALLRAAARIRRRMASPLDP